MADFEDFHCVANKETSVKVATLLRSVGIKIQVRVITERDCPEYVIAVPIEDMETASSVFNQDLGHVRTFTSGTEQL